MNDFLFGRKILSAGANDYSPVRDWDFFVKRIIFFKIIMLLSYLYVKYNIKEFNMSYNPLIHHRRSIRLKGFDYSSSCAYFITLCVKNRTKLFGHIVGGKMILNAAGIAAQLCWQEIPLHYPSVSLDIFVIMPDHVHGIILFNKFDTVPGNKYYKVSSPECITGLNCHSAKPAPQESKRPKGTSKTIGSVVRGYKIGVTKLLREFSPVESVWQRDYYEHIIRNYDDLNRIRKYIKNNPQKWR